jgi:hypothetical protein
MEQHSELWMEVMMAIRRETLMGVPMEIPMAAVMAV